MRRFIALAVVAGLLVSVACGGDDDDSTADAGDEATASGTTEAGEPTALPARPSPTPAPDDGKALTVRGPETRLTFTMAQIREMATGKVEGFEEAGVTLETLASELAFSGDTSVTFRGYRENATTYQFALGMYSELAPNTILYVNEAGQLGLKSGALEESAWLAVVDEITFD